MAQRNKISFKGQNVYVGIDVHRTTWSVSVLTEHGNLEKTIAQSASPNKLFDFLNKNYPEGNYHAVYEAGFSGFSTYYSLQSLGIDCMIINPSDVPTTDKERKRKTDAVDSAKLARSLRAGELEPIYIMPKDCLDDRGIVRVRQTFIKELGGYKNRVKHLLYCNGIEYPERFKSARSHWTRAFMKWLTEDVQLISTERQTLDLMINEVENLRKSVLSATRALRNLANSEKYRESYANLMTVPGIGPIVAITILTEIADFGRFSSERDFTGYVGLVPNCHESGDHSGAGEMTSRGNKRLRCMFIEASWVAIGKDTALNALYGRCCQRMSPNQAIVRVARRLSHICLAIVKTNKTYDPTK